MPKLRLYTRMSCSPRRRERLESKVWDALDTAKQLDPVSTSTPTTPHWLQEPQHGAKNNSSCISH
jgi:hypothetical protein